MYEAARSQHYQITSSGKLLITHRLARKNEETEHQTGELEECGECYVETNGSEYG